MAIIERNGILEVVNPDPVQEEIVDLVYNLTQERRKKQISQMMLAEMTGMPQSTISRVESLRTTPSLQVLIRIATALGFSLGLIQTGDTVQ